MERFIGKVKWFGTENHKTGKYNDYGFINELISGESVHCHRSQLMCQEKDLQEGVYVSFGKIKSKKGITASGINLLKNENNKYVLMKCFLSDDLTIWETVREKLNNIIPINEQIQILMRILDKKLYSFLKYFPQSTLLCNDAKTIRDRIPVHQRFELFSNVSNDLEYQNEIINAINEQTDFYSPSSHPFWKNYTITGEDDLYLKVAPANVQEYLYKKYYQSVLSLVDKNFETKSSISWNSRDIYKELSAEDKQLASTWISSINKKENKHEIAKMLSARAAEKVAIKFYEQHGVNVDDIAIMQLSHDRQNNDWQTHDLLLDGKIPIDVKNARKNKTSKSYSEHVVPAFKKNRHNENVKISCVLSPYMKPEPNDDDFKFIEPTQFLGETSYIEARELESNFSINGLITLSIEIRNKLNVIPPWLLDYPDDYYSISRELYDNLHSMNLPSGKAWNIMGIDPIYLYITNGISLPDELRKNLTAAELEFYDQVLAITSQRKIRLPDIFLLVLTNFLQSLNKESEAKILPYKYLDLIFKKNTEYKNPFDVKDPLNIIHDLCKTLIAIYETPISFAKIKDFREFKFSGSGLLSGRQNDNEKWFTIIAYCGGLIEKEGYRKCGYSPLITQKHETCPKCNHLICPECHYCSRDSQGRNALKLQYVRRKLMRKQNVKAVQA
ncbi:cold-shock protein [Thiothrix subterranea]|uniref:cold-shock protein n=1 Tax=Thiothrix subterranea TaxID=2735563 RepID=UPI00280B83C7|nr:cold shock domain-containing protein [Thiothrix subterranea]